MEGGIRLLENIEDTVYVWVSDKLNTVLVEV